MNEDFSPLMALYDLPIGLPGKINARNDTGQTGVSGTLTVANFTKKTIEVINKVYDRDFALRIIRKFHLQMSFRMFNFGYAYSILLNALLVLNWVLPFLLRLSFLPKCAEHHPRMLY